MRHFSNGSVSGLVSTESSLTSVKEIIAPAINGVPDTVFPYLQGITSGVQSQLNTLAEEVAEAGNGGGASAVGATDNILLNVNSSMSVSDIQTLIDNQPKNLNGFLLRFTFAAGTYNLGTSCLLFDGFVNGTLQVRASGAVVLGSSQSVIITSNYSSNVQGVVHFKACTANVILTNIRVVNTTANANNYVAYARDCFLVNFQGCSFKANAGVNICIQGHNCLSFNTYLCRAEGGYIGYSNTVCAYFGAAQCDTLSTDKPSIGFAGYMAQAWTDSAGSILGTSMNSSLNTAKLN